MMVGYWQLAVWRLGIVRDKGFHNVSHVSHMKTPIKRHSQSFTLMYCSLIIWKMNIHFICYLKTFQAFLTFRNISLHHSLFGQAIFVFDEVRLPFRCNQPRFNSEVDGQLFKRDDYPKLVVQRRLLVVGYYEQWRIHHIIIIMISVTVADSHPSMIISDAGVDETPHRGTVGVSFQLPWVHHFELLQETKKQTVRLEAINKFEGFRFHGFKYLLLQTHSMPQGGNYETTAGHSNRTLADSIGSVFVCGKKYILVMRVLHHLC